MTRIGTVAVLMAALGLAACSSGGGSVLERMRPIIEKEVLGGPIFDDDPEVVETPEITRATLDQIPFALRSIQIDGSPRSFVVATADNGGNVEYQDRARRSLVFRGGLISASHGLGYNLSGVTSDPADPVAIQTPVADWPQGVYRNYEFSLRGRADYEIAVYCTFQPIARERIEIVELFFDVTRVQENCANGRRSFQNMHWADEQTGFIWKSTQWIGPRLDLYTTEVLRPFGG